MDYQILNLLFRCNKEFSHEKIRKQELSDTECMICSYIYSHENCSQDDVSVALKTDKTTVGKALMSLENKGCVVRTQDEADKRIKRLSLTDVGRKKVAELIDIHNNCGYFGMNLQKCLYEIVFTGEDWSGSHQNHHDFSGGKSSAYKHMLQVTKSGSFIINHYLEGFD